MKFLRYIFVFVVASVIWPQIAAAKSSETWIQTGTKVPFVAKIKNNQIRIYLEDGDNSFLYWSGTFPKNHGKFVFSIANRDELRYALLGSQNKVKVFTMTSSKRMKFKYTILGTTTTIYLDKI